MKLIDTSCWTQAIRRKGDPAIRARVEQLLETEEAAWCDVVRLELWHGAASDWDKQLLEHLEASVRNLPITPDVWQRAMLTAARAREQAVTVPVTDILIFSCASVHGVSIERADRHFDLLERLQLPW
jgi:predicted nucleic acid-binding protein